MNKEKVRNSVEVFKLYSEFGETALKNEKLLQSIIFHFKGDLMTFHANGYAKLLSFKSQAFNVATDTDEEEDLSSAKKCISKPIKRECESISLQKSSYTSTISMEICGNTISKTLQVLLENLTPLVTL